MSDGPYRSLPMRPWWKKVAEWAENENIDARQVADRLVQAVIKDFRKEVPQDVVALAQSIFEESEGYLFADQRLHDLSNARRLADGYPLASSFVDCVDNNLRKGKVGREGLLNSLEATIHGRTQSSVRQMEEHYLRHPDSSSQLRVSVRERVQEAISHAPARDIALQVSGIAPSRKSGAVRHQGLDDGVPRS